ncbi:cupin domain-containing protein [Rufibacter hautae]|nr:cupin domain-containing protein [Rufibacter hautae]
MLSLKQTEALASERPQKGFKVADGDNRLHESVKLDGVVPIDFKVLSKDTDGDLAVMTSSNNPKATGPPLHIHPDFDEIFYVTKGEVKFKVGEEIFFLKVGDNVFIPRNVPHCFTIVSEIPATFLIIAQPAAKLEEFFRAYGKVEKMTPEIGMRLMAEHNMKVVGPPLTVD